MKISVIVPVYNAIEYLEPLMDCLLAQTYTDYEILLIDDGSTDGSYEVCKAYEEKKERVSCYRQDNAGAAAARNLGMQKAKGQYYTFVDADDTVSEDYLAVLWQLLEEHAAELSVIGHEKIYPNSPKKQEEQAKEELLRVYEGLEGVEALLYQKDLMSVPWGMLFAKELWEHIRFPEGTKAEDMGTMYRVFAKSKRTVYSSRRCYFYYQRANNTIFSTQSERNIDYFQHSREMVAYVKENYPQLMDAARSRHFSACCQILSETEVGAENAKLLGRVYADLRRLRNYVRKDPKAKRRNRMAAELARVTIKGLHGLLRVYYIRQCKQVGKAGRN